MAQVSDSTKATGDTLATIESDTSITYIIQDEPVTIFKKIEILRAKIKIPIYLSIDFSVFSFSEKRIAAPSFEAYTSNVNNATKNSLGYSIGGAFIRCPRKLYSSLHVDFESLAQQFQYTDTYGTTAVSTNRFNYINFGIQMGSWMRKNKSISIVPCAGISADYLASYSGFTFDKKRITLANRLDFEMKYRPYQIALSAHLKVLMQIRNQWVEIEPYFIFLPMSATPSNEVYSVHRSIIGLTVGIINKLF